jgi:hypothetical protein
MVREWWAGMTNPRLPRVLVRSSKPKNGFIPFTRRSVRLASQSTAAAGSHSGASSAIGSPGLRAQISHLGSSFFGGAQQLAKGDDAVERLAQMVVEVQKVGNTPPPPPFPVSSRLFASTV